MGFGGKGRICAEAAAVFNSLPSVRPKKLLSLLLKSIMSDTEEDPGAPLTQADIPTLVRAVADAIAKASATPATKDPPGEP